MTFNEARDALLSSLPPSQGISRLAWDLAQCEDIPEFIQFEVFEISVRHSHEVALELVHQTADDGITGPIPLDAKTLRRLHDMDRILLRARLTGAWLLYVFEQPEWRLAGNQWARRLGIYLLSL